MPRHGTAGNFSLSSGAHSASSCTWFGVTPSRYSRSPCRTRATLSRPPRDICCTTCSAALPPRFRAMPVRCRAFRNTQASASTNARASTVPSTPARGAAGASDEPYGAAVGGDMLALVWGLVVSAKRARAAFSRGCAGFVGEDELMMLCQCSRRIATVWEHSGQSGWISSRRRWPRSLRHGPWMTGTWSGLHQERNAEDGAALTLRKTLHAKSARRVRVHSAHLAPRG